MTTACKLALILSLSKDEGGPPASVSNPTALGAAAR